MKTLDTIVTLAVAAILLLVATDHLFNFDRFTAAIHKYDLVSPVALTGIAITAIVSMLSTGFGLLLKDTRRIATFLAAIIFFAFAAALMSAMLRGIELSCGCVVGERPVDMIAFLKPVTLAVACLFLSRGTRDVQ